MEGDALGLNAIRISAEAERDWQRRMQEPRADFKTRAVERAVKAGDAAARSSEHVRKKQRAERSPWDKAIRQRDAPARRVAGPQHCLQFSPFLMLQY